MRTRQACRLTARSSGPTRASRPVRSTGRAARRSAERDRYTDPGTMNDQRPSLRLRGAVALPVRCSRNRKTTSASVGRYHARGPALTQATRTLNTLTVRCVVRRAAYPSQGLVVGCGSGARGVRRRGESPGGGVAVKALNRASAEPYNSALQPTGSSVTPRAGHASRQPAVG